jgi:hypothetical protein
MVSRTLPTSHQLHQWFSFKARAHHALPAATPSRPARIPTRRWIAAPLKGHSRTRARPITQASDAGGSARSAASRAAATSATGMDRRARPWRSWTRRPAIRPTSLRGRHITVACVQRAERARVTFPNMAQATLADLGDAGVSSSAMCRRTWSMSPESTATQPTSASAFQVIAA